MTQAAIGGGDALSGALGAGSREAVSGLTEGKSDGLQRLVSIGVGAAAAAAAGGNSLSGASSAFYGEAYNRQLHQKEIDIVKNKENIKKFAEQAGITEAEAESRLAKTGAAMVDTTWSNVIGKDKKAEAFLSDIGSKNEAFTTATQEEKDNFNMNGLIVEKNKNFYFKNMTDVGMIVIEKDSKNPYGATAYVKNQTNGDIMAFERFVTRGVNVKNGNVREIAIREGIYKYDFTRPYGIKAKPYPQIKNPIDNTDKIPTLTPNQAQNGKSYADLVYSHPMNSNAKSITEITNQDKSATGSAACIGPGKNQQDFRDIFNQKEQQKEGKLILIRPDNK